jgi:hypothetical protein
MVSFDSSIISWDYFFKELWLWTLNSKELPWYIPRGFVPVSDTTRGTRFGGLVPQVLVLISQNWIGIRSNFWKQVWNCNCILGFFKDLESNWNWDPSVWRTELELRSLVFEELNQNWDPSFWRTKMEPDLKPVEQSYYVMHYKWV